MPDPATRATPRRVLLLITGSGRSGTSSLAGSLAQLGMHVPEPHVPPNQINPKGFFETAWVVRFHRRLLRQALVRSSDGSPRALVRVNETVRDTPAAAELGAWLHEQPGPSVLVKDNQALWFVELWQEAATEAGFDCRLLTSLRHPAAVVGSRDRVWGEQRDETDRRARDTTNVAAWLNGLMSAEVAGRGMSRAFVRYDDLITDWRRELARLSDQLDLGLEVPSAGVPHELDTWLDAGLRHAEPAWAELTVPEGLRDLAEDAWTQVCCLVEAPHESAATGRLDLLRTEYQAMYDEAFAVARDEARHLKKLAARTSAGKVRTKMRSRRATAATPVEVGRSVAADQPKLSAHARVVRWITGRST